MEPPNNVNSFPTSIFSMPQTIEEGISDTHNAGAFEKRRVTRLFIESLEVAFHLCNTDTEAYPLTMIFDVVNSIMPTAYILNTGYWVFYSTRPGQSVCVCRRFGLCCPHKRGTSHWVNMNGQIQTNVTPYSSVRLGKFLPTDFSIHVTPMINDTLRSYDVLIRITVEPFQHERAGDFTPYNKLILSTELRYLMTPEYFPHESKIVQFNPSPLANRIYAKYFMTLHSYYDTYYTQAHLYYKNTVLNSIIPQIAIVPFRGPVFQNQSSSSNNCNLFNFSVVNEVNIDIYTRNNYRSIDYQRPGTANFQENASNHATEVYQGNQPKNKQKRGKSKYYRPPRGNEQVSSNRSNSETYVLMSGTNADDGSYAHVLPPSTAIEQKPNTQFGYVNQSIVKTEPNSTVPKWNTQGVEKKEKHYNFLRSQPQPNTARINRYTDEYLDDVCDYINQEMECDNGLQHVQNMKVNDDFIDLTKSPSPYQTMEISGDIMNPFYASTARM